MGMGDYMISSSSPKYELSTSDYNDSKNNYNSITNEAENEEIYTRRKQYFLKIETKIEEYKLKYKEVSFEKIPIKYTQNKVKNGQFYLTIWFGGFGTMYNFTDLFKLQKINKRYYCCKNCVDLWKSILDTME